MKREWVVSEKKMPKGPTDIVERLLALRGIAGKEEISEFLNPYESSITHPNAFSDMQKAVSRISKAIEEQENILIYGDFDADGVTSTSLLLRTFNFLGAKVSHFIPDREKDGHGLNTKAIVKQMAKNKPKLIITVDCGVSDVEQIDFVNSFKVDVIITDHHEAPEVLPKALAIINPKAPNALDEKLTAKQILHLTSLAGVGVAFKLACAVLENYEKTEFIYEILPYVAVGTIADVVPLIGENRYFVTKGLELISGGRHYGLKRLLEVAGYTLDEGITSENIAFGVAPRLNASGRLDSVEEALKLLVSDNKQEIEMAIVSLNNFNQVRQELCENTYLEALEMLKSQGNSENSIILYNPKWHIGIIGIVASKLVEKFYKPVFLMTFSEETNQVRCSSRSIEGVNVYDVLSANAELFDGFGGHAMAGGLSFSPEKTTFEVVKDSINSTISEILGSKILVPILKVDLELDTKELDINIIGQIDKLQPFGAFNPSPIFASRDLKVVQKKLMGSNRNHLKLTVEDKFNNVFDCIWWSKGDISLVSGDSLDIAYSPQINTFNGATSIQLILHDIHAPNLLEASENEPESESEVKIYDHRRKTDIFKSVNDYVKSSKMKIGVFAEDRGVLDDLKSFSALKEKVFNRTFESTFDVVMFFDYPANHQLLKEILFKAKPKFIHFMNYKLKKMDEKDFLKTISGMLKFACNNKDGDFDLIKCAAFLSVSNDAVVTLLDAFAEAGLINIIDKSSNVYKLELSPEIDVAKVLHTVQYQEFLDTMQVSDDFKKSLLEDELSNLLQ